MYFHQYLIYPKLFLHGPKKTDIEIYNVKYIWIRPILNCYMVTIFFPRKVSEMYPPCKKRLGYTNKFLYTLSN